MNKDGSFQSTWPIDAKAKYFFFPGANFILRWELPPPAVVSHKRTAACSEHRLISPKWSPHTILSLTTPPPSSSSAIICMLATPTTTTLTNCSVDEPGQARLCLLGIKLEVGPPTHQLPGLLYISRLNTRFKHSKEKEFHRFQPYMQLKQLAKFHTSPLIQSGFPLKEWLFSIKPCRLHEIKVCTWKNLLSWFF